MRGSIAALYPLSARLPGSKQQSEEQRQRNYCRNVDRSPTAAADGSPALTIEVKVIVRRLPDDSALAKTAKDDAARNAELLQGHRLLPAGRAAGLECRHHPSFFAENHSRHGAHSENRPWESSRRNAALSHSG